MLFELFLQLVLHAGKAFVVPMHDEKVIVSLKTIIFRFQESD